MKFLRLSVVVLAASVLLNSCIKSSYDAPPSTADSDPHLTVSTSIQTLVNEALGYTSTAQTRVLGDTTLVGVVVADDKSGNFYKQIIIEDSNAGIIIGLDKTYLYSDYPVGRKVYVKTKGLYLVNYNGSPELAYSVTTAGSTTTVAGIPSSLISNYLVKGSYPNTVTPIKLTVSDLYGNPSKYYNRLITLQNMQFTDDSKGRTYANSISSGSSATSLYVTDCPHVVAKLTMYNSAYASFQPYITPSGNGDLTCICSNYKGTLQMLIRDTTDVNFTGPRCP